MIKTILVPLTGNGSEATLFKTALEVARPFESHVEFVPAAPDPAEFVPSVARVYLSGPAAVAELLSQIEVGPASRIATARRAFDDLCDREHIPVIDEPPGPSGVSFAWRGPASHTSNSLLRRARECDLVVCDRSWNSSHGIPKLAALLSAGRPLILAPSEPPVSIGRHVVVGWGDNPEAAHALTAAMPFLRRALRVTVCAIDGGLEGGGATGLIEQLRWHRIEAIERSVPADRNPGLHVLVAKAQELEADLLVAGSRGHSHLHALLGGNFPIWPIGESKVPLLLCQ